jgi:sugar phosphate isomerase/epimerase
MYLLARTQMLQRYSVLESLDVIKELGFDGVEISYLRKDFSQIPLEDMPVSAIREKAAALGLSPNSVSMHGDFVYDDNVLARLKQTIPVVRDFGTRILITNGPAKKTGDQEEWALYVARTRELVKIAEANDVVVAIEFEPNFVAGSTVDVQRLLDAVPSDHLAANLDLGHVFLCDPEPLHSIASLGDKIAHCHIEDMPKGTHDHRLPGEGDMDLPAFLHALRQVGFDGGMALDLYAYDYETVAAQAVRILRNMIAGVMDVQ